MQKFVPRNKNPNGHHHHHHHHHHKIHHYYPEQQQQLPELPLQKYHKTVWCNSETKEIPPPIVKLSGYLKKKRNKVGGWRKMWFVLQDQLLLSYVSKDEYDKKLVSFKDILNIVPGTVIQQLGGSRFTIQTTSSQLYTFRCDDNKACTEWICALMESLALKSKNCLPTKEGIGIPKKYHNSSLDNIQEPVKFKKPFRNSYSCDSIVRQTKSINTNTINKSIAKIPIAESTARILQRNGNSSNDLKKLTSGTNRHSAGILDEHSERARNFRLHEKRLSSGAMVNQNQSDEVTRINRMFSRSATNIQNTSPSVTHNKNHKFYNKFGSISKILKLPTANNNNCNNTSNNHYESIDKKQKVNRRIDENDKYCDCRRGRKLLQKQQKQLAKNLELIGRREQSPEPLYSDLRTFENIYSTIMATTAPAGGGGGTKFTTIASVHDDSSKNLTEKCFCCGICNCRELVNLASGGGGGADDIVNHQNGTDDDDENDDVAGGFDDDNQRNTRSQLVSSAAISNEQTHRILLKDLACLSSPSTSQPNPIKIPTCSPLNSRGAINSSRTTTRTAAYTETDFPLFEVHSRMQPNAANPQLISNTKTSNRITPAIGSSSSSSSSSSSTSSSSSSSSCCNNSILVVCDVSIPPSSSTKGFYNNNSCDDVLNVVDSSLSYGGGRRLSASSGNVNCVEPIYAVVDLKNKYAHRARIRELEEQMATVLLASGGNLNAQQDRDRPNSIHCVTSSDYEEVLNFSSECLDGNDDDDDENENIYEPINIPEQSFRNHNQRHALWKYFPRINIDALLVMARNRTKSDRPFKSAVIRSMDNSPDIEIMQQEPQQHSPFSDIRRRLGNHRKSIKLRMKKFYSGSSRNRSRDRNNTVGINNNGTDIINVKERNAFSDDELDSQGATGSTSGTSENSLKSMCGGIIEKPTFVFGEFDKYRTNEKQFFGSLSRLKKTRTSLCLDDNSDIVVVSDGKHHVPPTPATTPTQNHQNNNNNNNNNNSNSNNNNNPFQKELRKEVSRRSERKKDACHSKFYD